MSKKQNFIHHEDLKNLPLLRKYKRLSRTDLITIIEQLLQDKANAHFYLICALEDGLSDKLYSSIKRHLIIQGYEMENY